MAATVLHSFSELAKVFKGDNNKAKKVAELATYVNVEDKCGRKAAIIWAFLNDQECCKRYGSKGEIQHDMEVLKVVTGYDEMAIFNSVLALVRHGFAKLTADGSKVRAA